MGNPLLVQLPIQFQVCPQSIVACLGVVVQVLVRVVLAVQPSQAERQRRGLSKESVGIVQRQDIALVGRIGRGGIIEGTCMLQRGIQHTLVVSEIKPFVQGNLTCVLIDFTLNHKGRFSLEGVHLDDTIRQVAIFDGRNTADNLYTLDIGSADGAS